MDNPSHECNPVVQLDYKELLIWGMKDLLYNVSQRFIYPFRSNSKHNQQCGDRYILNN